ncbi:hypothetical protein Tco_0587816 [Tanacetum coccineum]
MIPDTDLHQFDVYNDGYFSHLPLTYVDGVILEIAVPRMPYEQLAEFLAEKSTSYMFDVEETFGRLTLYLDHLDMNFSEYLSQAITYDMDADACVYKKIGPPKKRTSTTDGVEARNSTTQGVEARTTTKDKGKEKVLLKFDFETKYESDDDSDYQSDKLVDYLSPGENELIKLRNRMKANRKAKAKAKDKPDEEMKEQMKEKQYVLAVNVRGETFEEHDIYMNELLKSLKTADKDRIIEDPFISVEKHVERYPMYDETTHWRLRKPKVGEKCYARWMTDEKTFQCISLVDEHTCVRNFNFGALVNYKWIAKIFGDKIRANPDIRLCDIADLVLKKYKCKILWKKIIYSSILDPTIKLGSDVNPVAKLTLIGFMCVLLDWQMDERQTTRLVFGIAGEGLGLKERQWANSKSDQHKFWHVIPAGGNLYEVRSGSEGFTVDEDMYFVAYHNYVKPVPGMNFWTDQSMYSTVLPSKPRKMPGRPRKKRIRAIGEGVSLTRVSKVGSQGSCSNCKKPRHNKSSCKEPVVEQTPKPKGVVSRPRKKQLVDDFEDVDVVQRGPVRDEGASGNIGGLYGLEVEEVLLGQEVVLVGQ